MIIRSMRYLFFSIILGFLISTNAFCDLEVKDELRLGRSMASVIAGIYGIYESDSLTRYVSLVGSTQALINGRKDIRYYFSILDSDEINAYACPGGYIFITKGLLFALKSEAELSGILAHEIAHVNYKHVYKAVLPQKTGSVDSFVSRVIGARNVSFSVAFNQIVNKGLGILLKNGLQHEDEFEADTAALFYLNNVGYRSVAYKDLLDRLKEQGESYSDTHPKMKDRVNNLEQFLSYGDIGLLLVERFNKNVK